MNTPINETAAWKSLLKHYQDVKEVHLREFFEENDRFGEMNTKAGPFLLDFSKNRVTKETLSLLKELAESAGIKEKAQKMMNGDAINWTEDRAVLHTALRCGGNPLGKTEDNIIEDIEKALKQVKSFSEQVRNGDWKGFTGKQIKTIVHIGIGGSDLGPRMVCNALRHLADGPEVRFASNIDGSDIMFTLKDLDPAETMFFIASKTFTTQETMTNAQTAKDWLLAQLKDEKAIASHFMGITASPQKATLFGIPESNCFGFWDFVGGRYSVWSTIGLPIACYLGFDQFRSFLDGAHFMDKHFMEAEFSSNMPMLLGLLGVWYNNFFEASSHAVLPYSEDLTLFPAYLQQGDMESNGKRVNETGQFIDYQTGPIIWGQAGTNGQHAFYQLIHQGTKLIPADFIGFKRPLKTEGTWQEHHDILMSHFFAQTKALAFGLNESEAKSAMEQSGMASTKIEELLPHKQFEGNRPTNTLLIDELSPYTMGALIALYEHKIFVQGVIWQINSFDQWGVELGKVLAKEILPNIKKEADISFDNSTNGLLTHYKR